MSQTTLTSFFTSRKRPATDDISMSKSKVPHIDRSVAETKKRNGAFIFSPKINIVPKCENNINKLATEKPGNKFSISNNCEEKRAFTQDSLEAFAKKINATNISKPRSSTNLESVNLARKELSLGDIKKKLANSPRLAEIKQRAEHFSKGFQQLKDTSSKKNLKEFKSLDVEVHTSPNKITKSLPEFLSPKKNVVPPNQEKLLMSPRKVVISPVKSPRKVSAYMKYASLAASPTSLSLPHHYRFLGELFRAMETVVSLLYNRNEKITFAKLKPSVKQMLKVNFTEKHLSQIKNLVPDFYNFEVQKFKNLQSSQKESYEMLITPKIPNDIKILNPSMLLERRRYFYDRLIQLVKKHHSQYLLTLNPPMTISDEKLIRWHPDFDLEKIPEVDSAKLPEVPGIEKYSTVQDVLAKARDLLKCNTKMERALEKLAQAKARGLTQEETAATGLIDQGTSTQKLDTSNVIISNPALRNLPPALLEMVKAKQAAKALEAMTRSSEDEKKYLIYCRLPDLARTLRNIYVTERKNVLALSVILSKLHISFKTRASPSQLQHDIEVLCAEMPEWIKIHDIRNTTYLKLNKNADLKKIICTLEALIEKYKHE